MTDENPTEDSRPSPQSPPLPSALSVLSSTVAGMTLVMAVLVMVRWMLPPLLESSRYSWFRGQLRAEHDSALEQLRNVSFDGLSRISQLVSQRVTPSVVHISVDHSFDVPNLIDGDEPKIDLDELKLSGQGSGILVDKAGYILTNYHVIERAETIQVRYSDESTDEASIVGIDRARDLAVLRVRPIELPAMDWGNSDEVSVGTPVWAVGSPFGLHGSVTFGILSSKHRVDLADSEYRRSNRVKAEYSDLMQSDVAVNPGNSGGPLVNARGELVGVNTAILGSTFQGVSFSIPSNLAKTLYEQILAKSKKAKAWLGVELGDVPWSAEDEPTAKTKRLARAGAFVVRFMYGRSPAKESGVERGDIITDCDGEPIRDRRDLIERVGRSTPGRTVRLKVIRSGSPRDLDVVLGTRFVELDSPESGISSRERP